MFSIKRYIKLIKENIELKKKNTRFKTKIKKLEMNLLVRKVFYSRLFDEKINLDLEIERLEEIALDKSITDRKLIKELYSLVIKHPELLNQKETVPAQSKNHYKNYERFEELLDLLNIPNNTDWGYQFFYLHELNILKNPDLALKLTYLQTREEQRLKQKCRKVKKCSIQDLMC